MWKCMYVKQKDLVSAVAAAVELTLSPGGIMEDRGIEGDPDLADFEPTMYEGRRCSANAQLAALVHEHICAP